jgi:molybdopterin-guanine dinucleotide biosynthesis protein B
MDHEGTDTWRLAQAGATEVAISSPEAFAVIRSVDRESGLEEIAAGVGNRVDIIIAEGYKSSASDKIEISRSHRSTELVCGEEEILAVVSDHRQVAASVPVFGLDDVKGVAEFLIAKYGLLPTRDRESSLGKWQATQK